MFHILIIIITLHGALWAEGRVWKSLHLTAWLFWSPGQEQIQNVIDIITEDVLVVYQPGHKWKQACVILSINRTKAKTRKRAHSSVQFFLRVHFKKSNGGERSWNYIVVVTFRHWIELFLKTSAFVVPSSIKDNHRRQ